MQICWDLRLVWSLRFYDLCMFAFRALVYTLRLLCNTLLLILLAALETVKSSIPNEFESTLNAHIGVHFKVLIALFLTANEGIKHTCSSHRNSALQAWRAVAEAECLSSSSSRKNRPTTWQPFDRPNLSRSESMLGWLQELRRRRRSLTDKRWFDVSCGKSMWKICVNRVGRNQFFLHPMPSAIRWLVITVERLVLLKGYVSTRLEVRRMLWNLSIAS